MSFSGRIGHLEDIESPWGNAGGVVKAIDEVDVMARTGVGWVEAGSYTLEPRLGNAWNPETQAFDRNVYHHNAETEETFNSLGMPNKGMDVVEKEIPEMTRIAHAHNKLLVVNVAPVTEEPEAESVELIARAYAAGADAVLLNAGCPNIVTSDGGRHELLSRSSNGFWKVLEALRFADLPKPIFVRVSPSETIPQVQVMMDSVKNARIVSAVFTPNTWPGHRPTKPDGTEILQVAGGMGGRSGPATDMDAQVQLARAVRFLSGSSVDVVSSGGAVNAEAVANRLDKGAAGVSGTTFFYESPGKWREEVNKLLDDFSNIKA